MNRPYNFKLIVLGDSGVGKSSIVERLVNDNFKESNNSTIGISYFRKSIKHNGKYVNFDIWDTAGQEIYADLLTLYYRNIDITLIVYDITSKKSFERLKYYVEKAFYYNKDKKIILIIIGNKTDLSDSRKVPLETVFKYVKSIKGFYIETSAKNSHNIDKLFDEVKNSISMLEPKKKDETKVLLEDDKNNFIKKIKCC